ncbi:Hypp930 [Branchiostoma lanceolatum]|uniref:Hypp930 protein n=1 Tax=Branchiostoma lanceolatum TaxID=7740 RepID=A0A8K0ELD3_BRALA|nr:Hypp930 [Branchiostoma lanceolatum]
MMGYPASAALLAEEPTSQPVAALTYLKCCQPGNALRLKDCPSDAHEHVAHTSPCAMRARRVGGSDTERDPRTLLSPTFSCTCGMLMPRSRLDRLQTKTLVRTAMMYQRQRRGRPRAIRAAV